MPIDPMTGQYMPYTAGTQQQPGLAMRMLENAPGITASVGFSSMRGANTMMYGAAPRAKRASDFTGTAARRRAAMASGKTPFLKRAFANNNPLNPRNLFKYSDTSIFAAQGAGMYTPFAASGFLGERKFVKNALGMADETGSVLAPGLLSAISAGTRADRLERKYQRLNNGGKVNRQRARLVGRKLDKIDRTTLAIANMNGSPLPGQAVTRSSAVGTRGNLMASNLGAVGSQRFAGYFRGAMSTKYLSQLDGQALTGAQSAVDDLAKALGGRQRVAAKAIDQGLIKTVGLGNTLKAATTKEGAKFIGARTLGLALPGLQVVAAASFMYDVGKMAGTAVKGSIDLAKDSIKSMQGSIYKPMFGMGYNDTEAAATSRARGVMAIQNSRLNARSVLGYEAGTMAAHFG